MNELRGLAICLARRAGASLVEAYARGVTVDHKSAIDLVTDADRASEALITSGIRERFPSHAILAEESGATDSGGDYRWVIDPLDGTVNFAHGVPHFCVLIAVQRRTERGFETEVGVTLDPLRDELFVAMKGQGATLNHRPIRVSRAERLIEATGASGFSYDRLTTGRDNHGEFCVMNLVTRGVRRFGAAGLDLAYVACGRFDFYWEYALNAWDVAPGVLLVRESGGVVTDLRGGPEEPDGGALAASNGPLHAPMLRALADAAAAPVNARNVVAMHLPPDLAATLRERAP